MNAPTPEQRAEEAARLNRRMAIIAATYTALVQSPYVTTEDLLKLKKEVEAMQRRLREGRQP